MGRGTLIGLLLGAAVLLTTSAGKLNTSYLLPGSSIKIDRAALGRDKFCALTFDDGPDSAYTQQVQRILDQQGVHATFFVVGSRVKSYPQQVRTLHAAGHQIENHSWSHPDFTKLSDARRREELSRTTAELQKLGIQPRYFRPPFGAFNSATLKASREQGLEPLLWTVDPKDWTQPGASTIVSRVCKGCTSGAVILLHSTNSQTVAALPEIITRLRGEGYRFVTLDEWQALASGQVLPELPALPTGEPPSLREQVPGEPSLPDVPTPPAPRPTQLANAEDAEHPARTDGLPAEPVMAQNADPEWVESMSDAFYVPFDGSVPASAEAPPEAVMSLTAPSVELPWNVQWSALTYRSVVHSTERLRQSLGLQVAPTTPETAPRLPVGPTLRVYGNFAYPTEAAGIHDTKRSGPVRRVR